MSCLQTGLDYNASTLEVEFAVVENLPSSLFCFNLRHAGALLGNAGHVLELPAIKVGEQLPRGRSGVQRLVHVKLAALIEILAFFIQLKSIH